LVEYGTANLAERIEYQANIPTENLLRRTAREHEISTVAGKGSSAHIHTSISHNLPRNTVKTGLITEIYGLGLTGLKGCLKRRVFDKILFFGR
jgi:hypothetical protein